MQQHQHYHQSNDLTRKALFVHAVLVAAAHAANSTQYIRLLMKTL